MDHKHTPVHPLEPSEGVSANKMLNMSGPTRRNLPNWLSRLGIVAFCFGAAFLGSWAYAVSGLPGSGHGAGSVQERREVVLQEGDVLADTAKKVSPSVVSIVTSATAESFFGSRTQEGAGTGIIISSDGYIMTNKHVVPDGTEGVTVIRADGTRYNNVTVIGRDPFNDLAFLKINGTKDLPAATLGDSNAMSVGQRVLAIGNALGQYQTTVTSGIVSGKGRPVTAGSGSSSETEQLENLLQTDAAINPGNSGGPLVDLEGKVVGINVAVAEDAQGIGFSIPINDAKGLIKGVLATGKVRRGYLGVRYVSLTSEIASEQKLSTQNGAYIPTGNDQGESSVLSGGPADKAGVKAGDIITKVNGTEVTQTSVLSSLMAQYGPGDTVTLTIIRDGRSQDLKVTLEEYQE